MIVFELAAGSVWNLATIDWTVAQLGHLGYPRYLAYILGFWQAAAAVAIIVPRVPVLKEWAYVGAFFLWSGAVASHLSAGDGPESWGVPLTFGTFAVVSWLLRPADRRPSGTRLPSWETRPRAWVVPIALLVAAYVFAFVTLPAADAMTHGWAVERGWLQE